MKFELEKTWDTIGRLATWRSRQKQFSPKEPNSNAFNDPSKDKYMAK